MRPLVRSIAPCTISLPRSLDTDLRSFAIRSSITAFFLATAASLTVSFTLIDCTFSFFLGFFCFALSFFCKNWYYLMLTSELTLIIILYLL